MAVETRTLQLTQAQRRASERVNSLLAAMPRLSMDGLSLAWGQRLNRPVSAAFGRFSEYALHRSGAVVAETVIRTASGALRLRRLIPPGAPRALVLDFHGGGWVVGSAALNDRVNRHLLAAGYAVASVDYRLLDESGTTRLADAVADCEAAIRWALEVTASPLFIVGESAGAHLACLGLLALSAGERAGVAGCVFVQGVFDLAGTPSVRQAGPDALLFDGPNLVRDLARVTPELDEAGRRSADVSPLYADLAEVPPALFIVGECDPLRDDGRMMSEAWGGSSTLIEVPTAPHGFQHLGAPTAALAQAEIRAWLEDRLQARLSVDEMTR
ncbi:MAG: hypothetical protein A2623_00935 [Caulobacterales bacterium RIFCSPHIGHO2_01_FULL_70_19]|nr:MAG: hypothetical protein A2623_00935 [Caulobacterales bacterium RIFCSPHIGHO2_01_FULL_70_19]